MIPLRFNFKQIADLNEDLKKSPRALAVISQRVMSLHLRGLRAKLRSAIPSTTGRLRKSFRSISKVDRRSKMTAVGSIGFVTGKGISRESAIAANVLQKPGATAGKKPFLWIPIGSNRTAAGAQISPEQFFTLPDTFVRNGVAFQRNEQGIIPLFVLRRHVQLSRPPIPIDQAVDAELPSILDDIAETVGQVITAREKFREAL